MKNEYHFHINCNPEKIREVLNLLDGTIQTLSSKDGDIQITWKPGPDTSPFEKITKVLQSGNLDDGILLLELFLSDDPTDENVLYNLGMAVSDAGELTRAIDLLSQLIKQTPTHTNGRIALGVALLRSRKTEDGLKELETAVSREPENLWGRRNLGAGLLQAERFNEAIEHLRRATELAPADQAAWVGYGQALQLNGDITEADKAFIRVIELDEFSEIAERAREARTRLAAQSFHRAEKSPRIDAVMYCVSALEKFEKLSLEQVRQIGFEIALLGTRGLDTNSPEAKYTLKNLEGNYSGLNLVCYEFVAFKQFAPEQNIGFDLSAEYEAAMKLFKK
jgi:tetratricopeptide (TPR) repeat protein